jgi:hypothetical protein
MPGSSSAGRGMPPWAMAAFVLVSLVDPLRGFAPAVQTPSALYYGGRWGGAGLTCERSLASQHRVARPVRRVCGSLFLRASEESAVEVETTAAANRLWVQQLDDETGRPYYWNRETQEVTWYNPNDKGKSPVMQVVAARTAAIDARARLKAQALAFGEDPERDAKVRPMKPSPTFDGHSRGWRRIGGRAKGADCGAGGRRSGRSSFARRQRSGCVRCSRTWRGKSGKR